MTEFEIAIHSLDLNILPPLPNKENWEDIVMPPIETLEGKFELLKKEEARKKKFEEE